MSRPDPVALWARRAFKTGCLATLLVGVATHARAFETVVPASGASSLAALLTTAIIAVVVLGCMALLKQSFWDAAPGTQGSGHALLRRAPTASPAQPPVQATAIPPPSAAAWAKAPDLEPIPYDGVMQTYVARRPDPVSLPPSADSAARPERVQLAARAQVPAAPAQLAPRTVTLADATRQRILERYIGARFTGVAARGEDFLDTPRIVKSARLFFEDGQIERAVELLKLAIDVNPSAEASWLAMLEILFLATDRAGFQRAARRFASNHPRSACWPQVRQLGRKLGVDDAVITQGMAHMERHPNYGPWQGLPNWIQAPWDLTGDASLAELHARLRNETAVALEDGNRRVA